MKPIDKVAWCIFALTVFVLLFARDVHCDPATKYALDFGAKPTVVKTWMPLVKEYSKKYKVDSLLVSVIISLESSWNPQTRDGKIGERGLMQCHPLGCGQHLYKGKKTPQQWLESGVSWLSICQKQSKNDLFKTILLYATGRLSLSGYSEETKRKVKWRVNHRIKIYRKAQKKWKF